MVSNNEEIGTEHGNRLKDPAQDERKRPQFRENRIRLSS